MKIVDATNRELMDVSAITRDGNYLVIRGKIFGQMPMVAKLSPEEARQVFGLVGFRMLPFLASFLFRSTRKKG